MTTTTYSAPTTTAKERRNIVVAATAGNMLEFYDFTVYSYFALTIGHQFFPKQDSQIAAMLAFAVFALGFVSRPIGGIVLGYYADRKGRRPALTLTILLMGLGSALIGLAPTYATIGVTAPLLITVARLMQGFAQGGEFGAATTTLLETGGNESRAYRASWQLASQGAASLLGAAVATVLNSSISDEAMNSWGWRVPFLIGVLIVPVGLYLRRHLKEEAPAPISQQGHTPFAPRLILNWFLCVFSIMGMTISSYILMYYIPTYSIQYLHMPSNLSMVVALCAAVMSLVMCPIFGALSDRFKRRKPIAIIGRAVLALLLYPCFWLMNHYANLGSMMALIVLLMLFYTMGSTPAYALMPENFPKKVRATYLASAYAVSVALFGGTAQLVSSWLIRETGNTMAPAWYMIVSVTLSLIAVSFLRETGHKDLQQ